MMRQPVTTHLLHRLVAGSHAEGTTRLAVAVIIEEGEQVLLAEINNDPADAFDYSWQPPTDLVLPGETLTDAVHRTAAMAGIDIADIAAYLGHHDRHARDDVVRTFFFAATTPEDHASRRAVCETYQWADLDDLPDHLDSDLEAFIHLAALAADDQQHDEVQQLCAALRAHARGLLATEAAIELLVDHRCWLRRPDFVDGYLETGSGLNATPMAWTNWPAAITALETGTLPCSGSEAQMLRIAASLADGIPVNLRDALTGLDHDNRTLVIQAVTHTGGHC